MTDQALDLAVRMVAGALRPDDEPTSVEVGALVELVQALCVSPNTVPPTR